MSAGAGRRVLVVDDSEVTRAILGRTLRAAGFEVIEAQDGVEGLAALREAGGLTLAQDEASSVVYGMPRVALERGAADVALPPRDLGRTLVRAWEEGGER